MIISGNTFRSVLRENRFSTDLGLSFDTCTGVCDIGFSGQNKVYKVSFVSGKIFDHQSRYCGSYLPDTQVNINTNFSGTAYNYSINSDEIVRSGTKDDFYAERFFINLSGCVLDASIEIRSDKPSLSLSTDQTFITGSYITGTLSSNSPSGVKIFSGYFDSESPFSFYSIPTGLVKASSSQQILIQQNYPSLGGLISNYTLNTSAGDYDNELTITGVDVPFLNYIFDVEEGTNTLDSITQATFTSGVSKVGSLILNYGYETNREELVPTGLPINISLTYYSGTTGYMGMVSDVVIASGGNGYLAAPTVIFSGGFTGNQAQAINSAADQFRRTNSIPFTFYSGEPIAFYKPSGSVLPSPLQENYTYYVRDTFTGANTIFTISTGYGGPRFDITNTGSGAFYFYDPTKVASGEAILGVDSITYDSVVDVNMTYFGSGYNSTPTVIFSGGTGILNNFEPNAAVGIAETSFYTKSVTGFFDLRTGINDNLVSYRDNSFTSGSAGYVKNNVFITDTSSITVQVVYDTKFDNEILVAKLTLSGIDNNIIEKYITGVK
jgi:hypothetical protein